MTSSKNTRSFQLPTPRGMRWLTSALLASTALAACTADVVSGGIGGNGTSGDPPEDWSLPGFTDAGVPIICAPGSDSTCYSGPPGTLGVGSCVVGTRKCNGDGTAYSACAGDVAATESSCAPPSGIDCQGVAACGIATLWSHGFHGEQAVGTTAVSVDALGNSVIAGFSAGVVDLGTGPLSLGSSSIFGILGAFDAAGNATWSRSLGSASSIGWYIESMTRDAAGNIYIGGSFGEGGSLDLGAGPMQCHGVRDAFVAKLDPVGNLIWNRQLGDEGSEHGLTVGVDAAGNAVLSGWYAKDVADPYAQEDGVGIFVARWSASGAPLWSKRFGNVFDGGIAAVAPGGEIYLGGPLSRGVDFGGGELSVSNTRHVYLAKLDSAGNHVWSKSLGGKGSLGASTMSVDGDGSLVITGDYEGWANLGGAPLNPFSKAQPYLAKVDTHGNHLWSRTLGTTTSSGAGVALALAPGGEITVAGTYSALDADSPHFGSTRMFLSRISSAGAPLWGKVYGGEAHTSVDVYRIALDGSGNVVATGGYHGVTDFGSGALPDTAGWKGIFITRIAP